MFMTSACIARGVRTYTVQVLGVWEPSRHRRGRRRRRSRSHLPADHHSWLEERSVRCHGEHYTSGMPG